MHRRWATLALCVALGLALDRVADRVQAQGVLSSLGELSVDGASLDDPRVPMPRRVAIARALGHWGDAAAAVSLLTQTLSRRPSEPLRSAVIRALAERRSVEAVPELLRALRGRAGSTPWLIQALSVIGGTSVIEAMDELAKHGERGLRDAALRVLVRLAPDRAAALMTAVAGGDAAERQRLVPIAIAHPHRLWLSVLDAGLRDARTEGEAAALTWSLTRLPEGAGLPSLLQLAKAPGDVALHLRVAIAVTLRAHAPHLADHQRQVALDILQRGGTAAERSRLHLLATGEEVPDDDHDPAEDGQASGQPAEAAAHWRKALRTRGDAAIAQRVEAARQLGQLGDPKAHVPLIAALDDTSPDVRRSAVVALARLERDQAVVALRRHLAVELDAEVAEITARVLESDPIALDDPWFRGRRLRASFSPAVSAPSPSLVDRQVAPLAR